MSNAVQLTEAAAFTFGCAVLRAAWFDARRVETALMLVAALLAAAILVFLTPAAVTLDPHALDPDRVWPQPR